VTTGIKVTGGPELKVRLAAIESSFFEIAKDWQAAAVSGARARAPRSTGTVASSIRAAYIDEHKAQVRGAFWLIFIDRGTKAHDIRVQRDSKSGRHWITSTQRAGPATGYGKPKVLANEHGTVFGRKVHKRRQARRPFLTEAAQKAIRPPMARDVVIALWNRKRRGRYTRSKAA